MEQRLHEAWVINLSSLQMKVSMMRLEVHTLVESYDLIIPLIIPYILYPIL